MIDRALLQVIKYRDQYNRVHRYIPKASMDKKTIVIANDIGKYFKMDEKATVIDFSAFRSLFFNSWHRGMKDEQIDFYNELLTIVEEDVSEVIASEMIDQLVELEFATAVGNTVMQYNAGDDVSPLTEIKDLLNSAEDKLQSSVQADFLEFNEEVLDDTDDDGGLLWHIDALNRVYRNVLGGDQYIIAGRPGTGKTTFLTHLNYGLSQQMPENKVIVWFNNESKKSRIMSRQIQSALNVTKSEANALKADGTLTAKYVEAMGSAGRVRIYDIHGKDNLYLERILKSIGLDNVGGIIFDMLDNVRFPTAKEIREDQRLEKLYQWARERGVEYNAPTFATSQISNEGAGLMFPPTSALKDSKTGKQGACDGIIMIGSSEDPTLEHFRGISMPKTKSKREGQESLREEIYFDEDRGRFKG